MQYLVEKTSEDSGTVTIFGTTDEDRLTVEAEVKTGGWSASFPLYRSEAQELIEAIREEFGL